MIYANLLSEYVIENFILLILSIGLLLVLTKESSIGKRSANFIRTITFLVLLISLVDFMEAYCATLAYPTIWRKIFSWVGYSLRPLWVVLFIRSTIYRKKTLWLYSLVVFNSLIYVTTFIPKLETIAFTYDANNEFRRGMLGYSAHIISLIYIVVFIVLIFREFREGDKSTARTLGWCAAANVAAFVYETLYPDKSPLINTTVLASCCFYYLFLHTQITKADSAEKDLLLSDQRAAMVVQEIKPRFIYDILVRVGDIFRRDPKRAEGIINNLVEYLKFNLEMTDFVHPIPFEEEMDRVLAYLKIEQARLPNLNVELQLEDMDFYIPALTVQHFVENGIQHGLENKTGGTLTIKTFKSESGHSIIVQDDGKGFSNEMSISSENQGSRFGIANVINRLQRMVSGDVEIVTKPDVGTTVLISVPFSKE